MPVCKKKCYFISKIMAIPCRSIMIKTIELQATADAVLDRADVINWTICRTRRSTSVPAIIVFTCMNSHPILMYLFPSNVAMNTRNTDI